MSSSLNVQKLLSRSMKSLVCFLKNCHKSNKPNKWTLCIQKLTATTIQWALLPQGRLLCSPLPGKKITSKIFIVNTILFTSAGVLWHTCSVWQAAHIPAQVNLSFYPLCDLLSYSYHKVCRGGFMIPEENKLNKYVTSVVHSCMNKATGIPSITGWKGK